MREGEREEVRVVLRYKVIVETEKQRKALQAAAESGKQEGVQRVWGFKYTIFTGHFKGEERKVRDGRGVIAASCFS